MSFVDRLVVLVVLLIDLSSSTSYDDYKIIRVKLPDHESYLRLSSLVDLELFDLLTDGHTTHQDIIVSPEKFSETEDLLQNLQFQFLMVVENVQRLIEEEQLLTGLPLSPGSFSYDSYHTLTQINSHLDSLAVKYSDKAETFNLSSGTTYEGRGIQVIRITNDISSNDSTSKPVIWIDGGIHAREWVSPATVMFIIDSLLGEEDQEIPAQLRDELLNKYQFVLGPVINPDGYEYTKYDRLWRKTRKPSGCQYNYQNWFGGCYFKLCYGSDPNRNWECHFAESGVSGDPCSLVYPGYQPFDQPCTNIVKDYLYQQKEKLVLYMSYHSYFQLFLTPVGYSIKAIPPHTQHHIAVGEAFVSAVQGRHNMTYTAKRVAELYEASGGSTDWVYEALGVVDSYGVELRDTGEQGFELKPDQIRPTGEENVAGLLAIIDNLYDNKNPTNK